MDEFATLLGELEIRRSPRGGRRKLRGRFKYRSRAVLNDGRNGKPQKEEFHPGAFTHSINSPDQEISLLVGHSFDKPLAKKSNGSLTFKDSIDELVFDADIHPEVVATTYASDILAQIDAGLTVGASPGFRIPPVSAVPADKAQKFIQEDPKEGRAIIRQIFQAILFEFSIVHRPAYPDATVEPIFDALGNLTNADDLTDEQKLALGWTWQNGILVPPPQTIIKRAIPAALRWR